MVIFLFFGISILSAAGIMNENHNLTEIRTVSMGYNSRGNIWIVDVNGSGNFTKIQDAIDNASDGDVILVYNGTYYENISINKCLTIIGNTTEHEDKTYIVPSINSSDTTKK